MEDLRHLLDDNVDDELSTLFLKLSKKEDPPTPHPWKKQPSPHPWKRQPTPHPWKRQPSPHPWKRQPSPHPWKRQPSPHPWKRQPSPHPWKRHPDLEKITLENDDTVNTEKRTILLKELLKFLLEN